MSMVTHSGHHSPLCSALKALAHHVLLLPLSITGSGPEPHASNFPSLVSYAQPPGYCPRLKAGYAPSRLPFSRAFGLSSSLLRLYYRGGRQESTTSEHCCNSLLAGNIQRAIAKSMNEISWKLGAVHADDGSQEVPSL
ncbi:hypothetical protein GOP47_0002282 [Adiantum capillus-veneris]|uniref:Uncharacterized protein n=1 Tax=Adiantum capillus-veneris TaxID=13818 RepID=A0A9D4ZP22_ADICA|nr:hypothetical protein GOP47_0002282 [Adiantum capillus-veneris]